MSSYGEESLFPPLTLLLSRTKNRNRSGANFPRSPQALGVKELLIIFFWGGQHYNHNKYIKIYSHVFHVSFLYLYTFNFFPFLLWLDIESEHLHVLHFVSMQIKGLSSAFAGQHENFTGSNGSYSHYCPSEWHWCPSENGIPISLWPQFPPSASCPLI